MCMYLYIYIYIDVQSYSTARCASEQVQGVPLQAEGLPQLPPPVTNNSKQ